MTPPMNKPRNRALSFLLPLALLLPGCSDGSDDLILIPTTPPDGPFPPYSSVPGLNAEITGISGASGVDGSFQIGDRVSIAFKVEDDAGDGFKLSQLNRGSIYISGPTFNYQRVIAAQGDVLTRAVPSGGVFVYTFALPIPATYLPPYNDTPTFTIGELTGQPLLQGTYTVGLELRKDYDVGGETVRDPANAWINFRFAGASAIEPREVVTQANCNACHGELRIHGDNRLDVVNCLLCHTAGSEDRNVPTAAGGTPNVTVDFKVMIHKLHSGANLPSVHGVTTNPDGSRDYSATPVPYEIVGFGNSVHDYSGVQFPVWPVLDAPMPKDTGYTMLSSADKAKEDAMRRGAVSCDKCHGDPDGAGPLPAPAQGDLIYTQPSRMACGSCHDDWVFDRPYVSNLQSMPPQNDDSACVFCHAASGTSLDIMDAHLHPLLDSSLAAGTH
ncbi:MAG: multiheme c-type cytochrome, partial [Planctomycetota bacterium]